MNQQGLALHIGASEPAPLGELSFAQLPGATRDAYRLADLTASAGFANHVLTDSNATTSRVIAELETMQRTARPSDTVIVTFSGHGWQIRSSDPEEDDGFDEIWMLTDSYLVDTTIGNYLHGFDPSIDVIAIIDACRSRTASFIVEPTVTDVPLESILDRQQAKPVAEPSTGETRPAATVLTLAAVDRDDATAYEGPSGGLLTSALVSSLHELQETGSRPTWGQLWSRTVGTVRAYQTPDRQQSPIATLRGQRDVLSELAFSFEKRRNP